MLTLSLRNKAANFWFENTQWIPENLIVNFLRCLHTLQHPVGALKAVFTPHNNLNCVAKPLWTTILIWQPCLITRALTKEIKSPTAIFDSITKWQFNSKWRPLTKSLNYVRQTYLFFLNDVWVIFYFKMAATLKMAWTDQRPELWPAEFLKMAVLIQF